MPTLACPAAPPVNDDVQQDRRHPAADPPLAIPDISGRWWMLAARENLRPGWVDDYEARDRIHRQLCAAVVAFDDATREHVPAVLDELEKLRAERPKEQRDAT